MPARAVDRPFTYASDLPLVVGHYVAVEFGGRVVGGYVVEVDVDPEEGGEGFEVKPVLSLLGGPYLPPHAYRIAQWIADTYAAALSECLRLFTPPGHTFRVTKDGDTYRVNEPTAKPSMERWVSLTPAAATVKLRANAAKQQQVVEMLAGGPLPVHALTAAIGDVNSSIATLVKLGVVALQSRRRYRDLDLPGGPAGGSADAADAARTLTPGQDAALAAILSSLQATQPHAPFVLDGVTGSGKTEVYLRAIDRVLASGGGAIVLVPEISLTPQTVSRFRERFGDSVAVIHSRLSDGERLDQWDLMRSGDCCVVVGARSALFSPIKNLQLIVIDEEHDGSYKQGGVPRYHARDVAAEMAAHVGATLVVGSATPSIESLYRVSAGEWTSLQMPVRANGSPLPDVTVVDLAQEFEDGNRSVFSRELTKSLTHVREAGQKAVLLLNRRGYASFLLCRECGFVPSCNSCSTSLTYHESTNRLRCHQCDAIHPVPPRCPECASPYLRQFGVGTQRVESELAQDFEGWPVVRMDADTTTGKRSHQELLDEFRNSDTGVLLGTQMVAKGHDFPAVTLVGVISADTTLHLPDYQSGERTFHLLQQVAGRAGRGSEPGRVIIQTYWPEHPAIQAVALSDRSVFLDPELSTRRELGYPPFVRLCNVVVAGPDAKSAAEYCDKLASRVRDALGVGPVLAVASLNALPQLLGPAPCAIARVKNQHRYHFMVKVARGFEIGPLIRQTLKSIRPPAGVSVAVDVDPMSLA